jgi:AcrR family transcriptional regulator
MADADDSEHLDATPGLRERRRRETNRELADAALALFEERGVQGTTADDIAAAAGVSQRTFFRYAETKEGALFLAEEGFAGVLRRLRAGLADGRSAADALQDAWPPLLEELDGSDPADRERALRLRRLVFSEPSLLALALTREIRQGEQLIEAIRAAHPDLDELGARILVTVLSTSTRLALDEWMRRAEAGERASVRELHDEVQARLQKLLPR